MALGSFLRGLRPLGVWPVRPEPMAIHMSANELIHELSAIRVFVYPKHSEVDSRSHMCTTEDQLLLNIHLDAIGPCNPSTLLDEHKEHFSKCRTRSLDPWIRGSDAIAELGFVSRDYLDISSDSEGDEDYDPLEDETDEPAEEFLECDTEYYVSDDENSDNEGGTVEQD
ncbi:hypothetical protein AOQ84DRAFT_201610 [Glonium stellatum]|uniref:Uncharacterized protein n=1 Tax=Glonium stellatum TaxID=574774 RepID=A0A8E2JVD4_9PEZI|nr:hypothetical protein AOQ84DRAFT_201610 [Glonium stellatum]